MQDFKEFMIRIQTFDLRVIEDDIHMECGTNKNKHVKVYDLILWQFFLPERITGIERYGLYRSNGIR